MDLRDRISMLIRLDKLLADAGFGTRSQVRGYIKKKCVTVDGQPAQGPEQKVDITSVSVEVNGQPVFYETESYYILNKPSGILSASRDGREKTVVDLIPEPKRRDLFPVGRLDRDTVGLLLITNDGRLSNRLLAPGKHVEKTYCAIVAGELPENLTEIFAEGIDIGDDALTASSGVNVLEAVEREEYLTCCTENGISAPAEVEEGEALHRVEVVLTEGRYHEIKRMFEALGCRVVFLERTAMAGLTLPADLARGQARKITKEELIKNLGI